MLLIAASQNEQGTGKTQNTEISRVEMIKMSRIIEIAFMELIS